MTDFLNDPTEAPVVLIVEDDLDLLNAIGFAFETEGFRVRSFVTGEGLLDEAELPAYGCLILDQTLPGLTGLEVLERLRARDVSLPAVLITTADPWVEREAREAGVPLVEKPLMANALLEEVNRQLGRTR